MEVLLSLLTASMFIFGVNFLFSERQVLHGVYEHIKKMLPFNPRSKELLLKPFCTCPPCMASVWGTVYYLYTMPEFGYIIYIISLAGLNAFLTKYWNW